MLEINEYTFTVNSEILKKVAELSVKKIGIEE
jgi:hypothetical protein